MSSLISLQSFYEAIYHKNLNTLTTLFAAPGFDINVPFRLECGKSVTYDTDNFQQPARGDPRLDSTNDLRYTHAYDRQTGTMFPLTPFQAAILTGAPDIVDLFLRQLPSIDQYAETNINKTALGLACQLGAVMVVHCLVNAGASVVSYPGQHSILRIAIESRSVNKKIDPSAQIIDILITAGAARDEACLLHTAINKGDLAVMEVLFKYGADPNILYLSYTPHRAARFNLITPLQRAVLSDEVEAANLLLRNHANKERLANTDRANSPLGLACMHGSLAMLQLLLDAGANFHQILHQPSILHLVIKFLPIEPPQSENTRARKIAILINAGVTISVTTLHEAIDSGDLTVITLVLEHVNIESQFPLQRHSPSWITPLQRAIVNRNLEVVKLLLDKGANTETSADQFRRNSPLALACLTGTIPIVEELLRAGANAKDISGQPSILRFVIQNRSFDYHDKADPEIIMPTADLPVIQMLLRHGAAHDTCDTELFL